jgi:sulfur-carrier protein
MPARKSVTLHYYAALREAAGRSEEALESAARTAADLYDEVAARHGFSFDRSILRVVLNDTIVTWTSELEDGDSVVFLAPFAGG